MADTLILAPDWPTGATLYLRLQLGTSVLDAVASPKAFVPLVVANWTRYAVTVAESPSGSRRYYLDFLAFAGANPAIVAGDYTWLIFLRAGGSPASTDVAIGSGGGHWDGAQFSVGAVATLPTPAPAGYGPVGTGSVAVNQDYPTAGNLIPRTPGGQAISGAAVRAYLASEYSANPNTALIRGETLTTTGGNWANNVDLDPGSYVVTFDAAGYATMPVNLTVS